MEMRSCEQKTSVCYTVFCAVFVTFFIIDLFLEIKVVNAFGLNVTTGIFTFIVTYVIDDCLTELYGYARARFVMWITFFLAILVVGIFQLSVALPAASCMGRMAEAYDRAFSMGPRILVAILCGYVACSTVNSWIMSRLKLLSRGRYFKSRAFISSVFGRALDALVFHVIAFYGILSLKEAVGFACTTYLIQTAVETMTLPVSSRLVRWVKQKEGADAYDTDVSYNPFSLKV